MTVTQDPPQTNGTPLPAPARPPRPNSPTDLRVPRKPGWFERFARSTAILTGHPAVFFLACTTVVVWFATGPIFGFSDTWQLVINTGTTIVTFLMVFLIQQSQNRDTMAVQVKLAELIIAVKKADNKVAIAEDLSAHDLTELHEEYSRKANETLKRLEKRHGKEAAKAALEKAAAVAAAAATRTEAPLK